MPEFYRHVAMLDGHLNVCKLCVRARVKRHRRLNDSVREYDRQRHQQPERKQYNQENARKWNAENPDGYRAHYLTGNAIRDGRLQKELCVFCGTDKAQAHHRDYSKPLEITWLCVKCHHRFHALEKAS